ncbi:MAG: Rieske 2Fe-2S domain-containing protein [Gammaproteobacteria bacterium]|nr:Rieske 2Fe-2S domain-containing protein [Gammaproteobacteria bacterium]
MKRRDTLKAILGVGLGVSFSKRALSNEEAMNAPPQANDVFVFAFGDREGEVITPDDLAADTRQVFAYPMDPVTGVIRSGSRLNQVVLIRIHPDRLSERTVSRAAANVVAFSGVCTHTGCDVTDWDDETLRFQCPCHDSQFDPADGARVVGGPAPRPLPSLPLKLEDGVLAVAGGFDAPVGFQQPGLDPFGF